MELLPILLIIAACIGITHKLTKSQGNKKGADPKTEESPKSKVRFSDGFTDGEAVPLKSTGFFKGFGVPLAKIRDARVYKGSGQLLAELPETIRTVAQRSYDEGTGMGPDLMETIHHGRRLQQGEGLYIALVELTPGVGDVFTFVDRVH